ncbi:type II toxin-antitoxin system RelE/ParE family toxin [Ancylobacter sp. 6x-1]|uniref:Type II toxin-antitoxin system RelE/ParE family toxin n=2 Tax=Ancylobacter crimeensis TaxID=2579147 RepID=A0ABT0DCY5_9HYPH|nr:type II toxin-antitoxin system RelE/ParE family toxin [Ancylobacter crimeensis]
MTEDEVEDLVNFLANNPDAGDPIAGTGGCRKLRWAGRGKGKSGGYRTITFYSGTEIPAFLLAAFSKGEKVNLSKAERNALATMTKRLLEAYTDRVVDVGARS